MKPLVFFGLMVCCIWSLSCSGDTTAGQSSNTAESAEAATAQGVGASANLKTWKLQAFGAPDTLTIVPADMEITLTLDLKEKRVSGKAACNNYTGNLEGTAVGMVVATKKNCPGPAMDMEVTYLKMLEKVTNSTVQGDRMVMTLEDGRELVFGS